MSCFPRRMSMASVATFASIILCVLFLIGGRHAEKTGMDQATDAKYCNPDKLIFYKVVFHTFWTPHRFPRQYPYEVPTAQWSKLVGQTHSENYTLFSIGQKSSDGMKLFAEEGNDQIINENAQKSSAVYDMFSAPAIGRGGGRTETQFFVDGNHSLVSLVCRLSPSPDWFVGLDSFNLCITGNWVDSLTVEVNPMDAGTDNGMMFYSPDWPTTPQGIIYKISSNFPDLPTGSFYYPLLKRLPPIATFQFIKLKAYDLTEIFYRTEDDKNYEVFRIINKNVIEPTPANQVDIEIAEQTDEMEIEMKNMMKKNRSFPEEITHPPIPWDYMLKPMDLEEMYDGYHKSNKTLKKKKKNRHCQVSEWAEWSQCSVSCGVGEMRRERTVLIHPLGNGMPCPPLLQTKWCNDDKCNDDK